eukprot:4802551-Amphidinium_carterae.1
MKWIDTDKGDQERPNYRSRLVCREVKKAKACLCMTLDTSPKAKPLKLALWDISRAYLYGDAQRDLCVELLPEDAQLETDTEPMC